MLRWSATPVTWQDIFLKAYRAGRRFYIERLPYLSNYGICFSKNRQNEKQPINSDRLFFVFW